VSCLDETWRFELGKRRDFGYRWEFLSAYKSTYKV
jgi:hypothetical protein